MSLQGLEKAVTELSPDEYRQFMKWIADRDFEQ